jgi:predicted alpha/beta superfamily hydrolase
MNSEVHPAWPVPARSSDLAPPGWERIPENEAGDVTHLERVERYHLHSRALPDPDLRCVLVYLPPQYASEPGRRFPVFYLHDAQNLIDPKTSYVAGQTWRVHETADRLTLAGEIDPVILVGVANAGLRRMAEYTPGRDLRLGGGEGRSYGRLLIDELKPLVDRTYRTCPGPQDTALGGSSLGGLISLFLGLERPDVFGKIAAMSPSIWWDQRSIISRVGKAVPRPDLRVWLDMGTGEGPRHVRDAGMLYRQMLRQGWRDGLDVQYFIAEGAEHNEGAWAARFDRVLRFLFPPGERV